ncbi:inositol monophosphatase family protein [Nocardioides sp. Root151]|uniref:inositol monophosphatase family protein n=1 Tax=Nocardioides sp. Root151 TaxID=1736475 RepID=UPI0007033994|nr:inositol monophosphatase family protein [Nocardioides sp. Root151]KQZ70442.1 phosphatase [Nocardioides sp. Root151]
MTQATGAELSDVEVAISAAEAGAAKVREAYGGVVIRHAKSGNDFATDTDLAAERVIREVLAVRRPGDGFLGEETGESQGAASRRWLVDPLCGTLNFAAQTPLVAVNVALIGERGTLAAASTDPIAGETFWSDSVAAWVRKDGVDERALPSVASRLVDVNCDGPLDRSFVGPQLLADPEFRAAFGPRVVSSTLAVAWVAAGRRAGYVSDGGFVDNVHFAAGIELCRAAGCVVTDLAGGSLGEGRGLLVAADDSTHRQLLSIVRPHLVALTAGKGSRR